MDSPSRGACTGGPKLLFRTRDATSRILHHKTHKLGNQVPNTHNLVTRGKHSLNLKSRDSENGFPR